MYAVRMAKKKKQSGWMPFLVVLGAIALIGVFVFMNTEPITIDATQYDYTDDMYSVENPRHTITKFSDFQCPACAMQEPILEQIKETYPDVAIEYKHFPLRSIHPFAQQAAEAAECARDQGRFWAYHDVLFDNQEYLAENFLKDYAEALSLNMNEFNTCLDNREKQVIVEEDLQEGLGRGVSATPTLFLDGEAMQARDFAGISALVAE